MPNTSSRVVYLDWLRIIATFGVIFLHVYADGYSKEFATYNWYVNVIGDSLVRWAVPIFVMISGALFLNPQKDVTYQSIFKKNIMRLLLAYIFWWAAYSAYSLMICYVFNRPFSLDCLTPHFHLWFLPMLMGVYLFIPLLRKFVYDEKLLCYALLLWSIYIIGSFALNFVDMLHQISILFGLNVIIGYVGYFMLGYHLVSHQITKKQKYWIYFIGLIGATVCIVGNLGLSLYTGESNKVFLNNLSPQVIAMSMAVFVFVKEDMTTITQKATRLIDYTRKDLFGIYLTHAFWLMVLSRDCVRNFCNQAMSLPLLAIIIFILSLFTTKLIRCIPFVRKVVE